MAATAAGTAGSAMQFPPCPSTTAATAAATAGGTVAATSAAATSAATAVATTAAGATSAATPAATSAAVATSAATMAATGAASATAGYLGINAQQVANCGVGVVEVVAGGPAAQAGVQVNDVIVALNNQPTTSVESLRVMVEGMTAGTSVTLVVYRGTQQMSIPVTLGLRPAQTGGQGSSTGPTATVPSLQTAAAPAAGATAAATK